MVIVRKGQYVGQLYVMLRKLLKYNVVKKIYMANGKNTLGGQQKSQHINHSCASCELPVIVIFLSPRTKDLVNIAFLLFWKCQLIHNI